MQISGKNLCNSGSCVQCTGKRYDACGMLGDKPLVCDSQTLTCSGDKTKESTGPCQPCISDAQCKAGQLCAKQMYGGKAGGAFLFLEAG